MLKRDELVIRGEPRDIDEFERRLVAAKHPNWQHVPERERYRTRSGRLRLVHDELYFATPESPDYPAAHLVLANLYTGSEYNEGFEVKRIALDRPQPWTDDVYNAILHQFRREIVEPALDGLTATARIVTHQERLASRLPREVIDALRIFSRGANQSQLSPEDWMRWRTFVVRCYHRCNFSDFDGQDLDGFLMEDGWSEERRRQLVEMYEQGRSLLAEYDEELVSP